MVVKHMGGGIWAARNADGTALYVFAEEIDALRFVNREGYYMEVLLVPHGEDALQYRPPAAAPPTPPAQVCRG